MLEIENAVVVVFIFLRHTDQCGRFTDLNIFTWRNQYHVQIFVYVLGRLHARYLHGRNHACNL